MNVTHHMKVGDLLPVLEATLQDPAGAAVDLTQVTTVVFAMDGVTLAGTAAVDADPTTGIVRYTWAGADTATAGEYYGEFKLTWSGGEEQTIPASGYVLIRITEDLE
jgi:hypothetical protein